MAIAMQQATVVLPSEGPALVTSRVWNGWSGAMNIRFVRIVRAASAMPLMR